MSPLEASTRFEVWWWSSVSHRHYFLDEFLSFEAALANCKNASDRTGRYQIRKITTFDITVPPETP